MGPISPYAGHDLRSLIDIQAQARGEHPFLVWAPFEGEGRSWSYRAFRDCVARFAAGLHRRGVRAGDRLLIHAENCPETLLAWFGCAWLGAVAVTTNARASREELRYFIDHARVVAAVTQAGFVDLVDAAGPGLAWIADEAGFEAISGDPNDLPCWTPDPDRPFAIQYTSGTTARPKAVLWTHANALWGGQVSAAHEGLHGGDVHLVHLPLCHTNAQSYSVLASLWAGATIVLQPRFSASRFWDAAVAHGCTWSSMVPFCARALVGQPPPSPHRMRMFGSAVCAPRTDAILGVPSIGWWGMTETITHAIVGSPLLPNAPYAMGRAAPEYVIRVVDETGARIAPGEVGALRVGGVRGLSIFAEYVDDPAATAAAFDADGFLITGDRVRLDESGNLFFADREKDMLKVGGENVAASEIERVISSVAGVREVAVVGRRDPMLDEVPVAFVIADGPDAAPDLAERTIAACASELAAFKVPHEVRLVDDLPRATLEKVAKAKLRALLEVEPR